MCRSVRAPSQHCAMTKGRHRARVRILCLPFTTLLFIRVAQTGMPLRSMQSRAPLVEEETVAGSASPKRLCRTRRSAAVAPQTAVAATAATPHYVADENALPSPPRSPAAAPAPPPAAAAAAAVTAAAAVVTAAAAARRRVRRRQPAKYPRISPKAETPSHSLACASPQQGSEQPGPRRIWRPRPTIDDSTAFRIWSQSHCLFSDPVLAVCGPVHLPDAIGIIGAQFRLSTHPPFTVF